MSYYTTESLSPDLPFAKSSKSGDFEEVLSIFFLSGIQTIQSHLPPFPPFEMGEGRDGGPSQSKCQ